MKSEFTSSQLSSFRPSISHHRVPDPPSRRRLWELPVARFEARRLAAELRPDLVHGLYLTWHGWTAHDFGVRPFVLSALGSDVLDLDPRGDGGRVLDRLSARYVARRTHNAVANSDLVLADSVSLAETLRRRVPGTQVEIVRFGVEIREATSGGRTRWRNRLGIDEDAFVLLSSRLVRPSYNIDTIIRALPAIRDRCPGAVLVLKELPRFSDAEYRQTCMSLAHSLGVEDAVRVVGELDSGELAELYSAADVYVSVPTTDGTAVSVFEAMAAGVAVVATDAPGIDPAILADEQSALLVPVRDPDALATAVADLGMDPARKRRLAERAFEIVRRDGDFNRELDRAVRLYEDLLEAASRQRQRGSLAPGAAGKT
jgi:glycosyltransferase involved in cell wall biosynthesis